MQHNIPQLHTNTQPNGRTTGEQWKETDGQQEPECHFKVIDGRRHRVGRGVRGGRFCRNITVAAMRIGATDDEQRQPLDGGDDGRLGHGQWGWGTVLHSLILALLLSGLYMVSTDHMKEYNVSSLTDQRATFSFSEDLSNTRHKSTASWALHALERWMGWSRGGGAMGAFFEMRDKHLAAYTARLVDREPLTAWEQAILQAQACYEAECDRKGHPRGTEGCGKLRRMNRQRSGRSWGTRRSEGGPGHGGTGDQQNQESADSVHGADTIRATAYDTTGAHVTANLEAPLKRQRLHQGPNLRRANMECSLDMYPRASASDARTRRTIDAPWDVLGDKQREETWKETVLTQWSKRQVLTILWRETPDFLDVTEVIRLIGTPLTTLIGTMKHMSKRAAPVKAWATEVEAIAAPTIMDVLEASWKWDGLGEQHEWGVDNDKFMQLFSTYKAWRTLAYNPRLLAPVAALSPENRIFTDLGERIRASMRVDWPPASYGPVPDTPRPTVQMIKTGLVRRWYLHALAEATLYGAPHDGRLQKALRRELQGVFDPDDVILWIGDRWPVEGRMECVTIISKTSNVDGFARDVTFPF